MSLRATLDPMRFAYPRLPVPLTSGCA
jgi:hypothetical protein